MREKKLERDRRGSGAGAVEDDSAAATTIDFSATLAATPHEEGAAEAALAALVDRMARLLAVPVEDVDTRKPVGRFGIDSLVALEVRYWVAKELRAEISVFDIMNARDLEDLAATVAGRSKLTSSAARDGDGKGSGGGQASFG